MRGIVFPKYAGFSLAHCAWASSPEVEGIVLAFVPIGPVDEYYSILFNS
ncbi:MAG TPA: hypothetical protein VJN71_04750 [Nitrososphaerales archaeon]|nr:hypothetical protein [Nitrososphaerales archaeon]